jgi:hypothetical protein
VFPQTVEAKISLKEEEAVREEVEEGDVAVVVMVNVTYIWAHTHLHSGKRYQPMTKSALLKVESVPPNSNRHKEQEWQSHKLSLPISRTLRMYSLSSLWGLKVKIVREQILKLQAPR